MTPLPPTSDPDETDQDLWFLPGPLDDDDGYRPVPKTEGLEIQLSSPHILFAPRACQVPTKAASEPRRQPIRPKTAEIGPPRGGETVFPVGDGCVSGKRATVGLAAQGSCFTKTPADRTRTPARAGRRDHLRNLPLLRWHAP